LNKSLACSLFSHQESRPKHWAGICNAGITATNPTRPFDFVLAGSVPLTIGPIRVPFNAVSPPKPVSIDRTLRQLTNATELRTKIVPWDETKQIQLQNACLIPSSIH
jgi:hypothetical protein